MKSTEIVLKFLIFLADVRVMFRQVHLFAEKSPALKTVSTIVVPFKGEVSDYADEGVTISVALNAELREHIDPEKKAIGMSLLLRHTEGHWIAEGEVGWTGENVGWDPLDSREAFGATIEELFNVIPPLISWMEMRFKEEVAKWPN